METKLAAASLLLLLLFTLLPVNNAQVFCRSQINLANEACGLMRNFPGVRSPAPLDANETSLTTTTTTAYELARSRDNDDDGGDGDEEEGQGEEGSSSGRRRRRRRGHRHNSEGSPDPIDTACCRRVMSIDNACICQAVARLPVFMVAVRHVIKLRPVEGCDVSFECPGSSQTLG